MESINFHHFPLTAIGLFLAILFLQSGWDKWSDWEGNCGWLKTHFSKSPFIQANIPVFLALITGMELIAGTSVMAGTVLLLWKGNVFWFQAGVLTSCLTLLTLFAGQRMARDYAGAAALVPYFLVALTGLIILQFHIGCC